MKCCAPSPPTAKQWITSHDHTERTLGSAAEALEEAAKVADQHQVSRPDDDYQNGYDTAAWDVGADIRALATSQPKEGQ
jgi:hypothetical protein